MIYTITVLPVAIVRWLAFQGRDVPYGATAFADVLFCLSGLFNVVLYSFTRPALLSMQETKVLRRDGQMLPKMTFSFNEAHGQRLADGGKASISSIDKDDVKMIEFDMARDMHGRVLYLDEYWAERLPSIKDSTIVNMATHDFLQPSFY